MNNNLAKIKLYGTGRGLYKKNLNIFLFVKEKNVNQHMSNIYIDKDKKIDF